MKLESVLALHQKRYPLSEVQDWVKLLFQSEMGGGHMIQDPETSLLRLQKEFAQVESPSARVACPEDAAEPIGGGFCRLHLRSLPHESVWLQAVHRLFAATAKDAGSSKQRLQSKLQMLPQWQKSGLILPQVGPEAVERYLADYIVQGLPLQRHSETYRQAYAPAYRIVRQDQVHFLRLHATLADLLERKEATVVAIDGPCGSGKSTLASQLASLYDCHVFHMDDFFLRPEQRTKERLAQAGGNVDRERFVEKVLRPLKQGKPFTYRPYDCQRQGYLDPVNVVPKPLAIVEGSYSHHPELRPFYDATAFLSIDPEVQIERIKARSGPEHFERFVSEWIPLENHYFETMGIEERSDLIFHL